MRVQKMEFSPNTDGLRDSDSGQVSLTEAEKVVQMQVLTDKFWHDFSAPVEKPIEVLRIGSAIWGTSGNFSAIIGKAKSRKTFLVTIALAAISRKAQVCNIYSSLPPGQEKVLFFDTEQSSWHVRQIIERIKDMASLSSSELSANLDVYQLREADNISQRKDFIQHVLYNTKGIGLIIIDGIRDLVRSINDEKEATDLICSLMKWSSELNIHIVAVLHTNKNDANARGHVGTELMNKSETTLMVEKNQADDEISIVSPEYSRNMPFAEFAFSINAKGIPELTEVPNEEQRSKRKPSPDEIEKEQYLECADSWEGVSRIKVESDIKRYFDIGNTKAKEYLYHMIEQNYVIKTKIDGKHEHKYSLNKYFIR